MNTVCQEMIYQNHNSDKTKPYQIWFQERGELALFVVFNTQACRWGKCLCCGFAVTRSKIPVSQNDLMKQIDFIFSLSEVTEKRKEIKRIIVSNNGSVLDEKTFAFGALRYLAEKSKEFFSNLITFSLETRIEYIKREKNNSLYSSLGGSRRGSDITLEFSVGIEIFNSDLRNRIFKKGLNLADLEKLFWQLNVYYAVKFNLYFMFKPLPNMTNEEAIIDIKNTIDWADKMVRKYSIKISLTVSPTFIARGSKLKQDFRAGKYTPPKIEDLIRTIKYAKGKPVRIFIGIFNDGLVIEKDSRDDDDKIIIAKIMEFNKTGDFACLE